MLEPTLFLPKTRLLAVRVGPLAVATAVLLAGCQAADSSVEIPEGATVAPLFEVDPFWPKPLPNHWILGSAVGVGVDSRDHVYIIHRGEMSLNARTEMGLGTDPPTGECCAAAP